MTNDIALQTIAYIDDSRHMPSAEFAERIRRDTSKRAGVEHKGVEELLAGLPRLYPPQMDVRQQVDNQMGLSSVHSSVLTSPIDPSPLTNCPSGCPLSTVRIANPIVF